jgi:hypothetical protein
MMNPIVLTNIRLGWKMLAVTNYCTYISNYTSVLISTMKSFIESVLNQVLIHVCILLFQDDCPEDTNEDNSIPKPGKSEYSIRKS